jgi:CheY-like chemotaxis protein
MGRETVDRNKREAALSKILIVEDNEMLQEILSERLGFRGFEVVIARDGERALAITQQEQPDLILMDMSLPILDGWETTRRLKANPDTQHIPVIALTAHALSGDREKSLAAGCDDYEAKPVNFGRLLKKMNAFLKE